MVVIRTVPWARSLLRRSLEFLGRQKFLGRPFAVSLLIWPLIVLAHRVGLPELAARSWLVVAMVSLLPRLGWAVPLSLFGVTAVEGSVLVIGALLEVSSETLVVAVALNLLTKYLASGLGAAAELVVDGSRFFRRLRLGATGAGGEPGRRGRRRGGAERVDGRPGRRRDGMSRAVCVMQPRLLPHLGYFALMARVDGFVLFDSAQYVRREWINRNRIRGPAGGSAPGDDWRWIQVPVRKAPRETAIRDIEVSYDPPWRGRLRRTLHHTYSRAPFFGEVMARIEPLWERASAARRPPGPAARAIRRRPRLLAGVGVGVRGGGTPAW